MTDLQVKFQTLQEQRRANKVQETLKTLETRANVDLTEARTKLTGQEYEKAVHEVDKTLAEIQRILADTELSKVRKQESISKTVKNYVDSVGGLVKTGISLGTSRRLPGRVTRLPVSKLILA